MFCLFEQSSVSIVKNHCGNGTKKHKKPDGVNKSFVTYRVLVILHWQHHMAKRFCSACIVNLFESRIHRGCFRLIRLHVSVVIVQHIYADVLRDAYRFEQLTNSFPMFKKRTLLRSTDYGKKNAFAAAMLKHLVIVVRFYRFTKLKMVVMVNLIRLRVTVVIVANLQFLYPCSKVLTILFIRVKSIRFI